MSFKDIGIVAVFGLLSACTTFQPALLSYSSVETEMTDRSSMEYAVYTPPGWSPEESLPLILFLHGLGDSHLSFEKRGAADYFNQQIVAGKMPRVILVSPNGGRGFWENWKDGTADYRDLVMKSVLPKVRKEYNTGPCPEDCHLMGISMGGFGAMRFAYFNPHYFSSLSVISGAIFTEEQDRNSRSSFWLNLLVPFDRIFGEGFTPEYYRSNPYFAWVQEPELAKIRLQLMWADKDNDNILTGNMAFSNKLKENKIEHELLIFEGRHKWYSWLPNLAASVNFLAGKEEENPSDVNSSRKP